MCVDLEKIWLRWRVQREFSCCNKQMPSIEFNNVKTRWVLIAPGKT